MKPLLSKTSKPFLIFVLLVFVISIPVYFLVVDKIWKTELDEHNRIVADKTAYELNKLASSPDKLASSLQLWNEIQPETQIRPVSEEDKKQDTLYNIERQKTYSKAANIDRFRGLSCIIYVQGKPYRLVIETNIEESEETVAAIALISIIFFIIIVIGLLIMNKRNSRILWAPFRNTMEQIKDFNLNRHSEIHFQETDVREFEEMNQSITKLIEQNVRVYKSQREFTENASHELQTPLAILKSKLDLLLQDADLTESQYRLAEEMHRALTRSSRINKNLLLLAKIENQQFQQGAEFDFSNLLSDQVQILLEHFQQKSLQLDQAVQAQVWVRGNQDLTEILIHNLLANAVRHTPESGQVRIILNQQGLELINSGEKALHKDLLFKRFSKISKQSPGSGLGLSIVQEICKAQGWSISYHFENNFHIFAIHF